MRGQAGPARAGHALLGARCPERQRAAHVHWRRRQRSAVPWRSVRLGGNWLDGTQLSIEDALIQGATNVGKQGFKLTHYFMGFTKFGQLLKS